MCKGPVVRGSVTNKGDRGKPVWLEEKEKEGELG